MSVVVLAAAMARAVAITAIALGVAVCSSGCGAGSNDGPRVSESRVISHFRSRAGLNLARSPLGSDETFSELVVTNRDKQERRYGWFFVYIDHDSSGWLLSHAPDARGIWWNTRNRASLPFSWAVPDESTPGETFDAVAMRQYGANVVLVWMGHEIGQTDATWRRLDALLRELAAPAVCRKCILENTLPEGTDAQRYHEALRSEDERNEYEEAFGVCDPSADEVVRSEGVTVADARAAFITLLADLYGGGSRRSERIAQGLAGAFARITSTAERTGDAQAMWQRGCLDALHAALPLS